MLSKLRSSRSGRLAAPGHIPRRRLRWKDVNGFVFVLPWLIGFLVFQLFPFAASLGLSFTSWDLGPEIKFVGLENYARLLRAEPMLVKGIINTIYYTVFHVPGQMILAFIVAMLLNQKVRGQSVFRTMFYLPSITSGVASAIIWIWLFQPSGIINTGLALFGIQGPSWLNSTRWAMPAIIIMGFWGIGSEMVLYLAGLQGIPESLYEAAQIDGAGRWSKARYITIPLMTPYFFLTAVMGIIGSFQVFTPALVMTQGGPGDATVFLLLFMYWAGWEWYRMGYASAIAWVLMACILFFTAVQVGLQRYWVFYEFESDEGQ